MQAMLDTAQLQNYYAKYGQEQVDELVKKLSYKKAIEPLPKTESDVLPVMYIFRHGQSVDNADYIYSGWRDAVLTEEGREQAKTLAPKLKDKKIDMLVSSPQIRAIETMQLAIAQNATAKNLEIHTDKRIMERSYGDLQGTSKLEDYLEDPEQTEKIRRNFETAPPNGESLKMVCKRVADFCDEIVPLMQEHNLNIAVSCHGNSIRGFRRYFEKLSDEETAHVETPLAQDYAAYVIK